MYDKKVGDAITLSPLKSLLFDSTFNLFATKGRYALEILIIKSKYLAMITISSFLSSLK